MKPAHLVVLVVMNLFWAGTYSAFKVLGKTLTAGEIVTLRYTLAALVLGLLWPILPGRLPRGADLLKTALMGIAVFAIGPRLQVLGVTLGKAGDSSVLIALEPLVTAVAAACFLREHVPLRRWAGFVMGMAGVLLLNGVWRLDLHWGGLVANLIFVSSFTCEAAFSVIGKPMLERAGLLKVVALALVWGTLGNLAADGAGTWAKLGTLTTVSWLVVAYLVVICTVVGYSVWYVVIRETDVSLAAMTILIQPVFGVLIAAVALAEPLHGGQLWGAAAIAAGLALGLTRAAEVTSPRPSAPLGPE